MHPTFKELFIETDAEDRGARRTGGAACAGPNEPDRPWSSGDDIRTRAIRKRLRWVRR